MASPGAPLVSGQVPESPQTLYYTGKNINATKTSRTAITDTLQVGDLVIADPYGHDKGKGTDVTQPQTSFLNQKCYVVTAIKQDELGNPTNTIGAGGKKDDAGTNLASGWIEAVPCSAFISANTKANMTIGATLLGPANASFALQAKTAVDTLAHIMECVAVAQETADTSTTAAKKNVCFRGNSGL